MGKFSIIANVAGKVAHMARRGRFKAIEHAPELYFTGGTILLVGAVVATYKATLTFQDILDEHNERLAKQKEVMEKIESGEIEVSGYSKEQEVSDRRKVYVKTIVNSARVWAPVVVIGVGSVLMYGKSFGILNGRYISMAAAYSAVLKEKIALEERIKDELGEEAHEKVTSPKEVGKVFEDDGNGNVEEHGIYKEDPEVWAYSKFFDESNENWEKNNPEHNRFFLEGKQRWLTKRLKRDGYLFLNDVYDALGLPPTQAGQIMGWVYYEDKDEAAMYGSDCFVDFGLKIPTPAVRDFINGYENSVLLRFNVDKKPIIQRIKLLEK